MDNSAKNGKESAAMSKKGVIVLRKNPIKQPVSINISNLINIGLPSRNLQDQGFHSKRLTNNASLKAILGPMTTIHTKEDIHTKNKPFHKQQKSFNVTHTLVNNKKTAKRIPVDKIVLKKKPTRVLESINIEKTFTNQIGKLKLPLPSNQVLKQLYNELSNLEKCELLDYENVYYMGNGLAKYNYEWAKTFDDENNDYNTYLGEHLGYRYEILDILGKGSFGQVLKCIDHKTKTTVAVKIIQSKKRLFKQGSIEIKLLKYICDIDTDNESHVVKLLDSFIFRNHIVMPYITL